MAFATRTDGRPLTTLSAWAQRKSAEVAEVEPLLPTTVSTSTATSTTISGVTIRRPLTRVTNLPPT